jgi:dTMP kinase
MPYRGVARRGEHGVLRDPFGESGDHPVNPEKQGGDQISVGAPDAIEAASRAASGGYRRLFRNHGFRNMWIGQTISGVGDWLVIGLLIPLVSNLAPGSSMAVAGIMIAKIVPSLLMGSVLGVFVDRFDRRRLMIACDIVNGLLCLGLITATSGVVSAGVALALIYSITFLMEICNLLFYPAKNALIPMIVEERDLASANGLSYTTQQASMLIGLVSSGAIIAVFATFLHFIINAGIPFFSAFVAKAPALAGPQGGIVLDFFSFMLSATLITTIKVKRSERHERALDLRLIGRDVIESWRILRDQRDLRGILISMGVAILGGGAIISVGLVYVQQNLVGGIPFLDLVPPLERVASQAPQTFMLVFLALGMLFGSLAVPRFAERMSLEWLFVSAVTGFGLSLLGFSSVNVYWIAAAFGTAAGFCIAQGTVAGNTYIAETVADEVRGRVFAALESILRVAMLASMLLISPLGDLIGGIVRGIAGGNPGHLVLTGSRITLIIASLIILGGAVYASRAIDWRAKRSGATVSAGESDVTKHA